MLQNRQGNWFDLMSQIAVLTLHFICMDYYSDYKKDEVKMMHGVLGKARHECKMLPGKPYGKWLLGRDKEG